MKGLVPGIEIGFRIWKHIQREYFYTMCGSQFRLVKYVEDNINPLCPRALQEVSSDLSLFRLLDCASSSVGYFTKTGRFSPTGAPYN
ncbi:MAG: hypothetical protein ACP5U1_14685 [Desulfomonilaceae bacterium]